MRIYGLLQFLSLVSAYAVVSNATAIPPRKWPKVSQAAGCHFWDRDLTNTTRWVVYSAPECSETKAAGSTTSGFAAGNSLQNKVVGDTSSGGSDLSNKFQIQFQCKDATPDVCRKAEAGFRQAGGIISAAFNFAVPVVVNALFHSYGPGNSGTLGSASTTRFHLMTDDDGVDRLYPQSLVKQMDSTVTDGLSQNDIYAEFNADGNFWFAGDKPIQPNQHDFTYVVLHELFHGLGFASSWRDYFNMDILTPLPQTGRGKTFSATPQGGTFSGFQQFAFDKYIIETARNVPLGEAAKTIIAAAASTAALQNVALTPGASSPFGQALSASAVIPESKRVLSLASVANSMKFQVNGGTPIALFLETSLVPYRQGSSISHAAAQTSSNTPDFLMRFSLESGITLGQIVRKIGKGNPFGPVGPNLIGVMATLGYTVQPAPGRGITDFLAAAAESAGTSLTVTSKLSTAAVHIAVAVLCSGLLY